MYRYHSQERRKHLKQSVDHIFTSNSREYFHKARDKLNNYEEDTRQLFIRQEYGLQSPSHYECSHKIAKRILPSYLYYDHKHIVTEKGRSCERSSEKDRWNFKGNPFVHTCRSLNKLTQPRMK